MTRGTRPMCRLQVCCCGYPAGVLPRWERHGQAVGIVLVLRGKPGAGTPVRTRFVGIATSQHQPYLPISPRTLTTRVGHRRKRVHAE
jgi:hypothetical protein